MTREEAATIVCALIADHAATSPDAISMEASVADDLGLDSVDAVELLIALERRVGRRFELEHLDDIATVNDVVSRLLMATEGTSPAIQGQGDRI